MYLTTAYIFHKSCVLRQNIRKEQQKRIWQRWHLGKLTEILIIYSREKIGISTRHVTLAHSLFLFLLILRPWPNLTFFFFSFLLNAWKGYPHHPFFWEPLCLFLISFKNKTVRQIIHPSNEPWSLSNNQKYLIFLNHTTVCSYFILWY